MQDIVSYCSIVSCAESCARVVLYSDVSCFSCEWTRRCIALKDYMRGTLLLVGAYLDSLEALFCICLVVDHLALLRTVYALWYLRELPLAFMPIMFYSARHPVVLRLEIIRKRRICKWIRYCKRLMRLLMNQ